MTSIFRLISELLAVTFDLLRWRAKLLAVDAAGALMAAYRWVGTELSAVFTVRCDPFSFSRAEIPLRGTRLSFVILGGASEYDRRAAAWFYRWHATPTLADWCACVARFGLVEIPHHLIHCGPGLTLAVRIDAKNRRRYLATVAFTPPLAAEGPILLGGLEPRNMLNTLGLGRTRPHTGQAPYSQVPHGQALCGQVPRSQALGDHALRGGQAPDS